MDTFELTRCGYTEMRRLTHAAHLPLGWEWRSIADVAYRINKIMHPGYGEPFSPWIFIRSDGEYLDQFDVVNAAATGYLIFDLGYGIFACFSCQFDPDYGFCYKLHSCPAPYDRIYFR